MTKHNSFGHLTREEVQAICDAPSPHHRKIMLKQYDKIAKERAKAATKGEK